MTGPRGTAWSLVVVKCATWQGWTTWITETAGVDTPYVDGGGKTAVRRSLRGFGRPGLVDHVAPALGPMWSAATVGDLDHRRAMELMAERTRGLDRGGVLLWSVLPDARGRLPKSGGRRLSESLHVLPDRQLVVVAGGRGNWSTRLLGWPEQSEDAAAPGWFAHELGVK